MSDAPDIITLQARLEAAESETIEQARLLGMSGEREAKHLARIAELERELAAPINEGALRARNGGALPVGNGCEIAVRGTTAQLAERDAEVARMRAIFPEVLRRLKSGACSADCSLDFFAEIPNEVGLVVDALRARLAERDVATGSTRRVDVSKNTQKIDKCAPIIDAAMSATGGAR